MSKIGKAIKNITSTIKTLFKDIKTFTLELALFLIKLARLQFIRFEWGKGIFVTALYRQRGKLAKRFVHSGMAGIAAFGVMVAPIVAEEFPGSVVDPWEVAVAPAVLSASSEALTETLISEKVRDKIIDYEVQDGDTIGGIADKFGVSEDTIRWQNSLNTKAAIKVGQKLEILPVTGVAHKVQKGDTVYTIAKKYESSPQAIVDFPFNTFMNDETFELAIGQVVIVPGGELQSPSTGTIKPRVDRITPDAGTVVASGSFVWPASGSITQNFVWYHKGIDIANRASPDVLAADSGSIVYAGCLNWGYGCHIIIDHANGFRTLYAHLQRIYVSVGQTVARGNAIGKMGSTGRSTGIHLHFEVIRSGSYLNPLSVLR